MRGSGEAQAARIARGGARDADNAWRGAPGSPQAEVGTASTLRLCLRGGFSVARGSHPVNIPFTARRVIAFVALRNAPTFRTHVAEQLWPDASQDRAMGNLRSAIWRLRQPGPSILEASADHLALAPEVAVDVYEFINSAHRLLSGKSAPEAARVEQLLAPGDLLPDWDDDWVVIERERLRQLRLHALERVCVDLTAVGEFGRAIEAGMAAIAEDPLRESGHVALIAAHLREGNRVEALRQYDTYARVMRDELHLRPSSNVEELIGTLHDGSVQSRRAARHETHLPPQNGDGRVTQG